MKRPLSLLLVAVAAISLGATAARADHDDGDRQYTTWKVSVKEAS